MRKAVILIIIGMLLLPAAIFASGQSEEGDGEVKAGGYNIALSNGLITHSWRTQMAKNVQQAVAWYQGKGLIDNFYMQHAGFDVDLQISHVRNFINMGVDAIIIDPLSATAFNSILEEAQEEGILVIVSDEPVTSEKILQVILTNDVWMEKLARWVFDGLGGEGDIVYLSGVDGAPASDLRDQGFERAIADYPNINLLTKAYGMWDPSLAQQAMADIISAYPNIDGVVSQDGQCLATFRAFQAAGKEPPVVNGEGMRIFLEYWVENKDEGFSSYAIANGPGFNMTASLAIAVALLQGKEMKPGILDENTLWIDHRLEITDDNVEKVLAEHIQYRGVEDYIDETFTYDEILDLYFQ